MRRLLEDLWVHAQDIRIALGDGPAAGPGLRATLEVAAWEVPHRFPRLAPGVGAVEIEAGDFRSRVELGGGEPVRIAGDPVTVALVAAGRIPLEDAVCRGAVTVSARPAGLGEALNIYGP